MPRIFPLEGVWNVRDFGGLPSENGQVRYDRLYRTGHLNRPTEKDQSWLEDQNISLVVDLRYASERENEPNIWPSEDGAKYYSPMDERIGIAPHVAFLQNDHVNPDTARQYMMQTYARMPKDPNFQAGFANTLKHMRDTGEAVLVHCAAGKDRTGVLSAIILRSLGVAMDDIHDEYMMTLEAVDLDVLLPMANERMQKRYNRTFDIEDLRPMFGVEQAYLNAAIETMGDLDSYIQNVLGFSKADQDILRGHYVAS